MVFRLSTNLDKDFVIFCVEMLQQFSTTLKGYQHHGVFLELSEILLCENKIDKDFL